MRYEEITTTEAVNLSPHNHAYINPYNGCSMGCPFCFWLNEEGWEGRIQIKTNICQVLEEQLKTWDKTQRIYLGSVCDPFNELESRYRLSKGCLELIRQYEIPLLITTSAVTPVLTEYIPLLKSMKNVTIAVELARMPEINNMNAGQTHTGIAQANACREAGLKVYATLAPILPGIINLEPVLERLDPKIPIYVDSMTGSLATAHGRRTMEWIKKEYPHLEREYENIIGKEDTTYFTKLLEEYRHKPQIHTFPFEL